MSIIKAPGRIPSVPIHPSHWTWSEYFRSVDWKHFDVLYCAPGNGGPATPVSDEFLLARPSECRVQSKLINAMSRALSAVSNCCAARFSSAIETREQVSGLFNSRCQQFNQLAVHSVGGMIWAVSLLSMWPCSKQQYCITSGGSRALQQFSKLNHIYIIL